MRLLLLLFTLMFVFACARIPPHDTYDPEVYTPSARTFLRSANESDLYVGETYVDSTCAIVEQLYNAPQVEKRLASNKNGDELYVNTVIATTFGNSNSYVAGYATFSMDGKAVELPVLLGKFTETKATKKFKKRLLCRALDTEPIWVMVEEFVGNPLPLPIIDSDTNRP